MKLISLLFSCMVISLRVSAGEEPVFFNNDLPEPMWEEQSLDTKNESITVNNCTLKYCEKPSADELSMLEGLIRIEEQRRKYLEAKTKRKNAEYSLDKITNSISLNEQSTIHGLYVTQIASQGDNLVAKIFFRDRYVFKSPKDHLTQEISIYTINPTSVIFSVSGQHVELGLTPVSYIKEEHDYSVSLRKEKNSGSNQPVFAIPLDSTTTPP